DGCFVHRAVGSAPRGGQGQAEVRDPHLGVVAAVDRVDDDDVAPLAIAALPHLLGYQLEVAPGGVLRFQLPQYGGLRHGVDVDRAVTAGALALRRAGLFGAPDPADRSEEHTSELQSRE